MIGNTAGKVGKDRMRIAHDLDILENMPLVLKGLSDGRKEKTRSCNLLRHGAKQG